MTTRFADLVDLAVLSRAVGVPADRIQRYASHPRQVEFYDVIRIPKRGRRRPGQYRVVHAATDNWLLQLHRMIAVLIMQNMQCPDHVQGFVQGRSIRTNAQFHVGARVVLHGDLVDFFDAITRDQVEAGFAALGAPAAMAQLLAGASTIDGRLRQGTRCSPAIANLVSRHLDVDLVGLAANHQARYTRYGDNLTFSGDAVPESAAIDGIVRRHGFALRDGRCHEQRRGASQYVTGLTISDPVRPRLPRRLKRRIRLVMHYVEKYGIDDHFAHAKATQGTRDQRAIEGMLRFFNAIEPELTRALRTQFRTGLALSRAQRPPDGWEQDWPEGADEPPDQQ